MSGHSTSGILLALTNEIMTPDPTNLSLPSSQVEIDSLLSLGYFIGYSQDRRPIDFGEIDKDLYRDSRFSTLVSMGQDKLRDSVSSLYESGKLNVVPLSGGLDSRMLLGALLQHVSAADVYTYTYGIPGSYDYDIAGKLAQKLGTRHVSFPSNAISWHEDEMIEVARREDYQAVLFYNQPLRLVERLFAGGVFWSGYVGDAIAGSNLPDTPSTTLEEAKIRYLRRRKVVKSVNLAREPPDQMLPFVSGGSLLPSDLTWDEQVLFDEGARKFTAAHVLWKGWEYRTPFINSPWMDFLLSVPNRYRLKQSLMIAVGNSSFPELFSFPSKNRLGHNFDTPDWVVRSTFWGNRVRKALHQMVPSVNWPNFLYNDFHEAIRKGGELRRIVRSSTQDLVERGICDWVDVNGIWARHDSRMRNHGDALIALASLEIILKARELDGVPFPGTHAT